MNMHAAPKRGRKKKNKNDETASESEEIEGDFTTAAESTPAAGDGTPFVLDGIKRVDSTEGHQPPIKEESVSGRYAAVLFTAASQKSELYNVYEDMAYISSLYQSTERLR